MRFDFISRRRRVRRLTRQQVSRRRSSNRLSLESLEARRVLASAPIISEFVARNDRSLDDQDGDDSDWIELHNPGDEDISLNRWYLTDNPADLRKWRIPDVTLGAGEYLVVFASGKDRDSAEDELHTNFQLSSDGEYLALVEPDGQTVVHQYTPTYPPQVTDVSYGIPTGVQNQTLVAEGAAAAVLVPTDGSLDIVEPDVVAGTWLDPDLNTEAGGWIVGETGIGFVPSEEPVVLADSVADFSGVQGEKNWFYGTWTKNSDNDGLYSPNEFTLINGDRFFDPATGKWDLGVGRPPNTEITAQGGHPSSAAVGFFTHWVGRRWVSETSGTITIEGTLANNYPAGDGVIGHIVVNGIEIYQQAVDGDSVSYSVQVDVQEGDTVDFLIDPGPADDETADQAILTANIRGVPPREEVRLQVADSSGDWNRDGTQGHRGWRYGYYELFADADRTYDASDFRAFTSAAWTGRRWEWPGGTLETEISSSNMYPHADGETVHWAIRRWEVDFPGTAEVEWSIVKSTVGGDGLTGRVYHNGVQVDSITLAGDDRDPVKRTVEIRNVRPGDVIDLAVDPLGVGGDPNRPDGEGDRSRAGMTVFRKPDLADNIRTDIGAAMQGVGSSAYIRIPFQVANLDDLDQITLDVMYDDGFVAYVNGHLVASGNAPDAAVYNTTADTSRPLEEATLFESFDLTDRRDFFLPGTNLLQIQAINASADDTDLLILPQLTIGTVTSQPDKTRYFKQPTPGAPNGLGVDRLGPLVLDATHTPDQPAPDEAIVVTAEVSPTFNAVSDVTLTYRVMYDDSATVPMVDDGSGADQVAGDGIYTGTIPGNIATPGQMIRWFIQAADNQLLRTRFPNFEDPVNMEEYLGTVVQDPSIVTKLPVIHWFAENPRRAASAAGTSGSIFYDGEFYDNVRFDLHGQSSSGFPTEKKSMNVDLPTDHRFRLRDDLLRMKDFDLLTNFADKSKMRNTLGYEQRAATGGAYHLAFPVRVQRNGEFYAVYDFVEDADERWLQRIGFDPNGALYKMYNTFGSTSGAEKKTRKDEGVEDLRALLNGIRLSGGQKVDYAFDNVNLAQMANYLAGFVLTSNVDCCHKNYYAYQDPGTQEWWFLPWDVDLSNGRVWGGFGLAYFDDTMYIDRGMFIGSNNTLVTLLYNQVPGFRDMYLRRVRTLIDAYVKPPGTPRDQLPLESRVDELFQLLKSDADLDNERHPAKWGQVGFQPFDEAVRILLEEYAAPRRKWLYETQVVPDTRELPVLLSGVPGDAVGTYFVPTDNSLGTSWTAPGFDDAGWIEGPTGVGFERATDNFVELIQTDLNDVVPEGATSFYARIPFSIDDPSQLEGLTLRMKYDDGFVAYINGTEVVRDRLRQDDPAFDSTARSRSNRLNEDFANFAIPEFVNLLKPGENILAIHAINSSPTSGDMMILPELVGGVLSQGRGEIPLAQVGNPKIDIATIEFNPASGNQEQEYIQLVNNNADAVDISGWHLSGDIDYTFDPGTVIPSGWSLYAVANAPQFRSRTEGPTGGMRLFVQGNYEGRLPNVGGNVQLVGADGELVSATTYVGERTTLQDNLRISEVMYNPLGASAAELARDNSLVGDDFEFIEMINVSDAETLDLAGARFTGGVSFTFGQDGPVVLQPGERLLVVRNLDAMQIRYGDAISQRVAGQFDSGTALRNSGETIRLEDSSGGIIADFTISDRADQGWPKRADGAGSSLQVVDVTGDYSNPNNWRASSEIHGSPGELGDAPVAGLVVNEVLNRPVPPQLDSVELFNPNQTTVTTANYFLSDSARNIEALQRYRFAPVDVGAGQYLVLSEADFNAPGAPTGFGLSGTRGDELYLTVGLDGNVPTHFVDTVSFPAAPLGESFGRFPNGQGRLAPMQRLTLGEANSQPRVGPVVFSEIHYQPAEPSLAALTADPTITAEDLEFVEIHNPTATPVDLTEWRIRGGIDFDFPPQTMLGANETIVVVSFDPQQIDNAARLAGLRANYALDESVRLLGGYSGQLSDRGEEVRLLRPDQPPADEPDFIPRLLEDQVVYAAVAPWPDASGNGNSLTRSGPSAYGNDAASWVAAAATPGDVGPAAADVNGDGRVDVGDIDTLCLAVRTADVALDLTGDGVVDRDDLLMLVEELMGSQIGDVNLDGAFTSKDIVRAFQRGEYQDAIADGSSWVSGDWNCDGDFDESDLLFAFQRGQYEKDPRFLGPPIGPPAAVAAAVAAFTHDQSPLAESLRRPLAEAAVQRVTDAGQPPELTAIDSLFEETDSWDAEPSAEHPLQTDLAETFAGDL